MATPNTTITTSGNLFTSTGTGTILVGGGGGISIGNTNPNSTITISDGNYWNNSSRDWNPLSNLSFKINFNFNAKDFTKDLLNRNIRKIKKNKFIFNCEEINNRIQPYELIMKLIEKKELISVKIEIYDTMTINYVNLRFTEIENNFNFGSKKVTSGSSGNAGCDFSKIKVRFEYEKILTENHKLSTKQLRTDKMKKIMDNNESDND